MNVYSMNFKIFVPDARDYDDALDCIELLLLDKSIPEDYWEIIDITNFPVYTVELKLIVGAKDEDTARNILPQLMNKFGFSEKEWELIDLQYLTKDENLNIEMEQ